jgi:hypothetical protein
MGTISYFEGDVKDADKGTTLSVEIGTSGMLGNGPQLYINFGRESLILDHQTAASLCEAFAQISSYFGYNKKK